MSDLPQGWVETCIDDIAEVNPGRLGDIAVDAKISFVPMPAVSDTDGEIVNPTIRSYGEVSKGYTQFRDGDVIFAKITPCMENGKIAVARALEGGVACGSTEFHVVRPFGDISSDFLWRYLRQKSFRNDAEASMTGAVGQRRVPASFLKKHSLALPPLPEQQRILSKIDSLTSKSRRARGHLDHIPRLVEKYKQAILAAAFRGDLTREWRVQNSIFTTALDFVAGRQLHAREMVQSTGKGRDEKAAQLFPDADMSREIAAVSAERILPQDWCWTSIGCVFGVYIGATPSRKEPNFWNGNIPWVSSGEVAFCRIAKTRETISNKGYASTSTRLHPPGTVLIGMIGEGKTRGQVAILDVPACNNQNCAAIRVAEAEYSAEYVYWYLWSVYETTRNAGAGNNQPALNKDRVQRLILPLAPAAEAKEIAKIIETAFAWIDRLASDATSARKLIDHFDQAVFAKAFKGELVPQDPADEPASTLLDCIRAERAAATKAKGGRKKAV